MSRQSSPHPRPRNFPRPSSCPGSSPPADLLGPAPPRHPLDQQLRLLRSAPVAPAARSRRLHPQPHLHLPRQTRPRPRDSGQECFRDCHRSRKHILTPENSRHWPASNWSSGRKPRRTTDPPVRQRLAGRAVRLAPWVLWPRSNQAVRRSRPTPSAPAGPEVLAPPSRRADLLAPLCRARLSAQRGPADQVSSVAPSTVGFDRERCHGWRLAERSSFPPARPQHRQPHSCSRIDTLPDK